MRIKVILFLTIMGLALANCPETRAEMAELYGLAPNIGAELPNLGFSTLRGTFPDPKCPALKNEVGVTFPVGIDSPGLDKRLAEQAKAKFDELSSLEAGSCPGPGETPPNPVTDVKVTFTATSPSRNYLSLLDTVFESSPMAAHPSTTTSATTYNLQTGQPLKLSDLFADPAKSMPKLWAQMAAGFCEDYGHETLPYFYGLPEDQGCASKDIPLPDALKGADIPFSALGSAVLTTDGLQIILDAGDAWSYADGPAELVIPKDDLVKMGAKMETWN
ncbi:MAG: hypothetical protein LBP92_07325 [Deltaproteobacteria bacterium]|jgi:hypothetical protein|nr:hypothetical protein [Deltaproteobacteria bacterium]